MYAYSISVEIVFSFLYLKDFDCTMAQLHKNVSVVCNYCTINNLFQGETFSLAVMVEHGWQFAPKEKG